MEGVCPYCQEPFNNQPQTELPCLHRYHTQCFLDHLVNEMTGANFPDDAQCMACNHLLFPGIHGDNEQVQENETVDTQATPISEATRIQSLYESNRNFRCSLKHYAKALQSVSKDSTAFRKVLVAKKAEVAETFAQIKAQYEGLANVKKDEIQATPEYKAYRKAITRSRLMYQNLMRRYALHRGFTTYLNDKPGLRRLRPPYYYHTAPQWLIRRALRLRLKM